LVATYDAEFAEATRLFFDAWSLGHVVGVLSTTLLRELEDAPENVRGLLHRALAGEYESLDVSEETARLAEAYVRAGVVPPKYADDALHVALATVARVDVLVSWNFKHLVNPARVRAFNGVNIAWGYGIVTIMTPAEIVKILEAEHGD
jgi:hypothetical protein